VIVTITLNPALHVEYSTGKIAPGAVNQVRRVGYRAGGRGLAVARVLHTFGHDVVAAGLVGGSAGELIRNELARAGVATQFTRIAAESRRIVAVTDDSDGQVTSFAEPGPYITTEELGRLAADYRSLLVGATAVVLCGSLPEGLPPEIYGSFVSYAAGAAVPVILDAGGSALAHGAARQPALVVPEIVAGPEDPDAAGLAGLAELADPSWAAGPAGAGGPARPGGPAGRRSVALLTGSEVRVLTAEGEWRASLGPSAFRPGYAGPASGVFRDALVAGLVPGVALGWSWPDILRHAVALTSAWDPQGRLDVTAYEQTLTAVMVQQLRGGHKE
jgi:tagatose 6-phosphate kinase